jgi:dienelactone hydrolase
MSDAQKQKREVSRRRLLQGMSAGSVATVLAAGPPAGVAATAAAGQTGAAAGQQSKVRFHRARLPVLREADVIVAGGSLAAVAAALEFARAGKSVVLIESRTYLGREV